MPEMIAEICVERKPLADLKPHPRNPRKHPKVGSTAWLALKASLQNDYFDPLVFNRRNGRLVSGHCRAKIMAEIGFTHADVSVVDYNEPTHLARMVAANTFAGQFDDEAVAQIAADLAQAGISGALAGWDDKEFAAQLEAPDIDDDDESASALMSEAAKLQSDWKVAPGEVFSIGRGSRLACGDSGAAATWESLLGETLADMVWSDPPYNVNYHSLQQSRGKADTPMLNDNLSAGAHMEKLVAWLGAAFRWAKPGAAIYLAHAETQGLPTRQAFEKAGWRMAQTLVWVKQSFTLGRQDYQWQHEPILYGWKPGAAHYWQGGFSQSTIIDDDGGNLSSASKAELIEMINTMRNARDTTVIRERRPTVNELHPTIKPIKLVARQIWSSSREGETVLELFSGSGTTILAAEKIGRRCVAAELDPKYCAVTLERARLAGLEVRRVSDV